MKQCPTCQLWVSDTARTCERCKSPLIDPMLERTLRRVLTRVLGLLTLTGAFMLTMGALISSASPWRVPLAILHAWVFIAVASWLMERTGRVELVPVDEITRRIRFRYDICVALAYVMLFLFMLGQALGHPNLFPLFTYPPLVADRVRSVIDGFFFVTLFLLAGLFLNDVFLELRQRPEASHRRLMDVGVLVGYFFFLRLLYVFLS